MQLSLVQSTNKKEPYLKQAEDRSSGKISLKTSKKISLCFESFVSKQSNAILKPTDNFYFSY